MESKNLDLQQRDNEEYASISAELNNAWSEECEKKGLEFAHEAKKIVDNLRKEGAERTFFSMLGENPRELIKLGTNDYLLIMYDESAKVKDEEDITINIEGNKVTGVDTIVRTSKFTYHYNAIWDPGKKVGIRDGKIVDFESGSVDSYIIGSNNNLYLRLDVGNKTIDEKTKVQNDQSIALSLFKDCYSISAVEKYTAREKGELDNNLKRETTFMQHDDGNIAVQERVGTSVGSLVGGILEKPLVVTRKFPFDLNPNVNRIGLELGKAANNVLGSVVDNFRNMKNSQGLSRS